MQLTPGARLGPFEILAQLGAGGMGEVYKARDTRLDRSGAGRAGTAQAAVLRRSHRTQTENREGRSTEQPQQFGAGIEREK